MGKKRKVQSDKLTMAICLDVQGQEGLHVAMTYTETTMATVLLMQQRLNKMMGKVIKDQIAGKI